MSITYAGTTLALANALPGTYDQAGYEAVVWVAGTCALHEVPQIMREWQKVSEDLVCATTNVDLKGSSKWQPISFKLSRLPGDAAQDVYEALEADRTGVGSFRMIFPGTGGEGGTIYFTALVAGFALVDGGGQDTIHTSAVELLIQSEPVFVAST